MFQTKGIITERPDECLGCGIQVVGEADATDPVDQVSLSFILDKITDQLFEIILPIVPSKAIFI